MSDIVIKTENLSKKYKLGVVGNDTLFRDIQSWWAKIRGKEDPHSEFYSGTQSPKKDFWALKDISFEIHEGDRVAFIGKNGAGKSTLLKILSRITTPTEGLVKIKGKVSSLLEVGTGFHPELTGRENIYLNGAILGMKRREIDRKLDEIIDFCEIEYHIDTPIKRYSSGMKVRLGFAVASHLNCNILIADEVLAVGDMQFQKKALSKMAELSSSEGRTILFVSHNLGAVRNLCNRGFVLDKGELIFSANNINNCICQYVENNVSGQKTISLDKAELSKTLELSEILVNGQNASNIEYSVGEKLKIEIKGKTKIAQPVCLELMIKSEIDIPLAYYNRFGHFGPADVVEAGDFYLTEEIEIPNIFTGKYLVSLCLVNPGVRMLVTIKDAFTINAIGIATLSGRYYSYNDVGFIKIN